MKNTDQIFKNRKWATVYKLLDSRHEFNSLCLIADKHDTLKCRILLASNVLIFILTALLLSKIGLFLLGFLGATYIFFCYQLKNPSIKDLMNSALEIEAMNKNLN